MVAMLRSWWQQIKQRRVAIGFLAIVLVAVIALIIAGYWFDWTGFNGNNKSGKTLWDWMQLLLVPFMLAIGGFWLNQIQKSREEKTTEQRANTERAIAKDNQSAAEYQAYLDKISEILLKENLRQSAPDDEVRTIARVRTLTIVPRLDANRQRSVLQFLYESGLIERAKCIIDLRGVDLNNADLRDASLNNTNLKSTHLRGANLNNAYLSYADLTLADLRNANLRDAYASHSDLPNADLRDSDLSRADLYCANLRNARLNGANLTGANLRETNLIGSNLMGANLSGARLIGANLDSANLNSANLKGSDLKDANLEGADLHSAEVTQEQLKKAKSLYHAILPDGSRHS